MAENAKRDSNHEPVLLGYTGSEVMMVRVDSSGRLTTISTITVSAGTPEHWNGNAVVGGVTVTFTGTTRTVQIHNANLTYDLQVSFDGGTKWFTIEAGAYFREEMAVTTMKLKGVGGTAAYESLAMVV